MPKNLIWDKKKTCFFDATTEILSRWLWKIYASEGLINASWFPVKARY